MYDPPHIRFIYTHAERHSGDYHWHPIVDKFLVGFLPLCLIHTSVVTITLHP